MPESWLPNTLEENHGISHFCLVKLIEQFLVILQTSGRSAFVISEWIKSTVQICLMQSDAMLQKKVLCKHSGWRCFQHELVLFTHCWALHYVFPVDLFALFFYFFYFFSLLAFHVFENAILSCPFIHFELLTLNLKTVLTFHFFFSIFLQGPKSTHTNSVEQKSSVTLFLFAFSNCRTCRHCDVCVLSHCIF